MADGLVPVRLSRGPRERGDSTTTQEMNVSFHQSLMPGRRTLAIAAGALTVLSIAAPASAKESAGTFSTAPTTTTASCSPIQSLKITGDTNAGDTNVASISVDYQVKPCDSKQVVTVETVVADYYDASAVLWDDTAAPESGKFTVYGVTIAKNYRVTITVRDASTGATVGSVSRLANVPRPTVV